MEPQILLCVLSNYHLHTESSVCHIGVKCIQILVFQIMFLSSIPLVDMEYRAQSFRFH